MVFWIILNSTKFRTPRFTYVVPVQLFFCTREIRRQISRQRRVRARGEDSLRNEKQGDQGVDHSQGPLPLLLASAAVVLRAYVCKESVPCGTGLRHEQAQNKQAAKIHYMRIRAARGAMKRASSQRWAVGRPSSFQPSSTRQGKAKMR